MNRLCMLILGLMLSFTDRANLDNETLPLTIQDGWYKDKLPGVMLGFFFNTGKYLVCDTSEKQEPKSWLRTDFIEFNGAKRVFIYISYTIRKCKSNSKYCKEQFKLYTAQTSKSASSPKPPIGFEEIAVAKPTNLKDGVPDEKDIVVLNATIKAKMEGFYLAFLDQGVCLKLYSIKVIYYFCPERGKYLDLVKFPKTISPSEDSTGASHGQVHGSCSDSNARNTSELLGVCTTKGLWKMNGHVRCLCKPGYGYLTTPTKQCAECSNGQYKSSLTNTKCETCPSGSYSFQEKTMCACHSGLFRMDGKNNEEPCYALPNGPKLVNITTWSSTSILLSWPPPSDKTVTFTVECFVCKNDKDKECVELCNNKAIFHPGKSGLRSRVSVSGLESGSRFKFKVFGVTRLNQKVDKSYWKYTLTFGKTMEGKISTQPTSSTTAARPGCYQVVGMTILGVLLALSMIFNVICLVCYFWRHKKEKKAQLNTRANAEYDMVNMDMNEEGPPLPTDDKNVVNNKLVITDKEQENTKKTLLYQSVKPHTDTYSSLSAATKLPPKPAVSEVSGVYQELHVKDPPQQYQSLDSFSRI